MAADPLVRVCYLELLAVPAAAAAYAGPERIAVERPVRGDYLRLYQRVGAQVRWDQRLQMPAPELEQLLTGKRLRIYVLRNAAEDSIGLCEFERAGSAQIELKNFGLVPEAQGRGLGWWLLSQALHAEWQSGATRIWLHTDRWDHPAALHLYRRAGFRQFAERDEPAGPL